MYNYKANSISTVIPTTVYNNYPDFVKFIETYYNWQEKTTIKLNNGIGNFDISQYIKSIETEIEKEIEATVQNNEYFIVDFSDTNQTFIRGEDVITYRPYSNPIEVSLDSKNNLLFNNRIDPNITLFTDQSYYFENNTGQPLYFKNKKTYNIGDLLSTTENNGSSSGNIIIHVNSNTPSLIYCTVGNTGIMKIIQVSNETFVNYLELLPDDVSIFGMGRVEELLYHPEYLYNNFNDITTMETMNSFFKEYLSQYGLDLFFRDNFKDRKALYDFIRFFRTKGTIDSIKFFFNNFFNKNISISKPGDVVLKPSDANYFAYDILYVDGGNDKSIEITRNQRIYGEISGAYAIIEAFNIIDSSRSYYKIYINPEKRSGLSEGFIEGEEIVVIDDDDSDIEYFTESSVLGTVSKLYINETGRGYNINQIISVSKLVHDQNVIMDFNIKDVTHSPIYESSININIPGSGYAIGDNILFPTSEKKLLFGATILPDDLGNNKYEDTQLYIEVQDSNYYTLNYINSQVEIDGLFYDVLDYDESTNRLDINHPVKVKKDQVIFLHFNPTDVVDPYYDDSYFYDSDINIKPAKGYISDIDLDGDISAITLTSYGNGYVKEPSTEDGSVFITTMSGSGADITISGQSFGGIKEVEIVNDVVGLKYDFMVTLNKTATPQDDDAKVQIIYGTTAKYGQFFRDNKSFLSDKMHIHDSYYYQDFSYTINTDLNISNFAELYKKLVHPIGTIFFNRYYIIYYFNMKINKGYDVLENKHYIIEILNEILGIDININTSITELYNVLYTILLNQYPQKSFYWPSANLIDLSDITGVTYSGITISGYENEVLLEEKLISRTIDENPISPSRAVYIEENVNGTGTISYNDTTNQSLYDNDVMYYSHFLTVSGTNTSFTTEIDTNDVLELNDDSLLVNSVISDTELLAQRINTTASGINTTNENTDANYSINQNQKTELHNASAVDITRLGDNRTLGDVSDIPVRNIDNIFLT